MLASGRTERQLFRHDEMCAREREIAVPLRIGWVQSCSTAGAKYDASAKLQQNCTQYEPVSRRSHGGFTYNTVRRPLRCGMHIGERALKDACSQRAQHALMIAPFAPHNSAVEGGGVAFASSSNTIDICRRTDAVLCETCLPAPGGSATSISPVCALHTSCAPEPSTASTICEEAASGSLGLGCTLASGATWSGDSALLPECSGDGSWDDPASVGIVSGGGGDGRGGINS